MIGTEQEFGIAVRATNPGEGANTFYPPDNKELHDVFETGLAGVCKELGIMAVTPGVQGHLSNGARLYPDCGHPEYSTQLEDTLEGLLAARIAGERVVYGMVRHAVLAGKIGEFSLYRNTADGRGESWGNHENYPLHRRRSGLDLKLVDMAPLAPELRSPQTDRERVRNNIGRLGLHLATRTVFAGGGGIYWTSGKPVFAVGAKASDLSSAKNLATTCNKPVVNLRDETLAIEPDSMRLHVTCGDPTSPRAEKMAWGTTRLVLDSIEHGLLDGLPFEFDYDKLHEIAVSVAGDPTCNLLLETVDGKKVRATDIQYEYMSRAQRLSEHKVMTADDLWILENWPAACDTLARDPSALDWAAWTVRLDILQRKFGDCASWGQLGDEQRATLARFNLAFDKISPDNPNASLTEKTRLGMWTEASGLPSWKEDMPSEELIRSRMVAAAPGSRDEVRGKLIATGRCSMVNWHEVTVDGVKHELPLHPLH